MAITIKKGLDIPIAGQPVQQIAAGPNVTRVALLGDDYHGMRPTMLVQEGESVRLGDPLFEDKKIPGVLFTSPGAGTVRAINRGQKRKFLSIEIDLGGDEQVQFDVPANLGSMDRDVARSVLVNSGMWTALRTRPFSKTPAPESQAHSIFVTAMDTQPLSSEPELIIKEYSDYFVNGLTVLTRINDGPVYVCTRTESRVPGKDVAGVTFEEFDGPHPAGNVGTHIHFLDPVNRDKSVWHISYHDVIAIGHLFLTGRILVDRVVSIAGPLVNEPKLFRTRLGANLTELVKGNLQTPTGSGKGQSAARLISGSPLSGHQAVSPVDYLGRFDLQVTALEEGYQREFLGWQRPGANKFSVTGVYLGSWLKKKFNMNTNLNGGHRAIVPVGVYERVMPLDLMPTQLLKSLIIEDTEESQMLGALELDEEDLSLCTYVCPGKYEYGSILRKNLERIEKEG